MTKVIFTPQVHAHVGRTNAPELPIGRFLKSKSLGGNRVILVVRHNLTPSTRCNMSDVAQPPVVMFDRSDPEMQMAITNAKRTFGYFWREVAWERRRAIPALSGAYVRAEFCDVTSAAESSSDVTDEHMWLDEIDYDGVFIAGMLLNSPNWLTSVKQGERVRVPLSQVTDWLYAYAPNDRACGGFAVNLQRTRMTKRERRTYDATWGVRLGDPSKTLIVPETVGILDMCTRWFGRHPENDGEHPMSAGMAIKLRRVLIENPAMLESRYDHGFTLLHQESLAGNFATVQVLLEAGADRKALNDQGMTPLQLAKVFNWVQVIELLSMK